jgi:hypothetical protein
MMQRSFPIRLRWVLCPVLTLAFGGCRAFGNCTYEVRDLDASTTISESVGVADSAHVRLEENRGSINGTTMSWLVTGPALKGHVLSAAFKDAADLSTVRLDLGVATSDRPEITQGLADTRSGANLGGVHDILASGRGVIQLQTDDPSRPTVTFAMAAQTVGDWFRPNCY